MKTLKTLLIPLALIALVVGIVSFTNHSDGKEDKKCTIKIVKNINGVETVVDSTFDCDEDNTWITSLNEMGDSLHQMMKVMFVDGKEGEFTFDIDVDENDEDGVKTMKFNAGDGKEMDMKFDIQVTGDDDENGTIKMNINGKEMEMNIKDLHEHLGKMHENMDFTHNKNGNVAIMIEKSEDGEDSKSIKIIKTIDDDGNVTVKKIVDGVETEMDEEDMKKMHNKHQMMFMGDDHHGNVKVEVKVDGKEGKKGKHIVIMTKVTTDDKDAKLPATAVTDKKELAVEELKFSPNPNDGKFNLSFNLNKKKPIKIKIIDIQGKEVYNQEIGNFNGKYAGNIDISENGEGIYILQIIQGDKASTSKIMIK